MSQKKKKTIASFTLGYFLCLLNEHCCEDGENNHSFEGKFLLHKDEIKLAIQNLYYDLFSEKILFNMNHHTSSEFYSLIKNINEKIKEKNHWGDDSFLETAFLLGSFLCLIGSCEKGNFNPIILREIISEMFNRINVIINHQEFSKTINNITSDVLEDRICSRNEIFYMISCSNSNHKRIIDIQQYIENRSASYSYCTS